MNIILIIIGIVIISLLLWRKSNKKNNVETYVPETNWERFNYDINNSKFAPNATGITNSNTNGRQLIEPADNPAFGGQDMTNPKTFFYKPPNINQAMQRQRGRDGANLFRGDVPIVPKVRGWYDSTLDEKSLVKGAFQNRN